MSTIYQSRSSIRSRCHCVCSWGNCAFGTFGFFNGFCYTPPIIGFSSTSWKDTVQNVKDTGEFVWNLATLDLAKYMNATAAHVAPDVSEF